MSKLQTYYWDGSKFECVREPCDQVATFDSSFDAKHVMHLTLTIANIIQVTSQGLVINMSMVNDMNDMNDKNSLRLHDSPTPHPHRENVTKGLLLLKGASITGQGTTLCILDHRPALGLG